MIDWFIIGAIILICLVLRYSIYEQLDKLISQDLKLIKLSMEIAIRLRDSETRLDRIEREIHGKDI